MLSPLPASGAMPNTKYGARETLPFADFANSTLKRVDSLVREPPGLEKEVGKAGFALDESLALQ